MCSSHIFWWYDIIAVAKHGASSAWACVCLCVYVTHFWLARLHPSHKCKVENKAALASFLCLTKLLCLVRQLIFLPHHFPNSMWHVGDICTSAFKQGCIHQLNSSINTIFCFCCYSALAILLRQFKSLSISADEKQEKWTNCRVFFYKVSWIIWLTFQGQMEWGLGITERKRKWYRRGRKECMMASGDAERSWQRRAAT